MVDKSQSAVRSMQGEEVSECFVRNRDDVEPYCGHFFTHSHCSDCENTCTFWSCQHIALITLIVS